MVKIDRKLRETAAGNIIEEMLSMGQERGIPNPTGEHAQIPELEGSKLAQLIEANFKRIDLDGDGISRKELAFALAAPEHFSNDEYIMLKLLSKYFDSIASLCQDQEEGERVKITIMDKDVLLQFLSHSNMTLRDIHDWVSLNERAVGLPPST